MQATFHSWLLAGLLAASAQAQPARRPCLRYEPDTVRISGTLRRHTFPGPPNYESIRGGDEAETGFYLDLPQPICAEVATGRNAAKYADYEPRDSVRRVQLNLDAAGYARLRPHLGEALSLRGTLYSAITGHHHAPIILVVLAPVRVGR